MLVIVAPVTSSRLVALPAAAWAALAAYVSFGAIAFTGPSTTLTPGARLGVLPLDALHVTLAILAGVVVLAIGLRGRSGAGVAMAVSPLALLFLPWLPFPVPAVFLIWTGALASLVWIAVAIALCAVTSRSDWASSAARNPVLAAGVASCLVFSLAAFHASPSIPGGDEPHYLVITQSLLYDGDLKIENNHQRGDYRAYFAGDLNPDSIRRGRNGAVYSIHAPGVPAIVLPAFAIGGYHGVVVFLILCAAAACALAWWLAWRVTGSRAAAWFGWASIALAAPWLLETFTVYPDGLGGVIVLTGFWALLRAGWEAEDSKGTKRSAAEHVPERLATDHAVWPWAIHGVALALLPWMHTRFAVLAATLGGLILVRLARVPNAMAKAIAFLLPPALSAVAWMFFFVAIYGAPDPSAPYGGRVDNAFAFLPNGLGGLLFDQGFGLIATAPVLVFALAGFARTRRLGLEWLVMALPYLLAVTTFAMWWAGSSGPARFLVPLLPPLAIPAACAWAGARSRGAKAVMLAALLVSAWLSAVMAGGGDGRLGYHTRNEGGMTAAPYLEWANHVVDLPSAFPAFVPLPVGTPLEARHAAARAGFLATLPWAMCLGLAAWFVTRVSTQRRRSQSGETLVAVSALTFACAVMAAVSIVWTMRAVEPVTAAPAQFDALRRITSSRVAVFELSSHRRLQGADAWAMRIEAPVRRSGRGGGRGLNRPLAAFPLVPPGTYLLSVKRRGAGDGLLMVGVGNDQFAIVMQPLAAFDAGVPLNLPAGARALTIRGDEGARDELDLVELRPIAPAFSPSTAIIARRAVRYDAIVAFFLDDRAFPEPSGFWVGGEREASVVLAPDERRGSLSLLLRNAPVDNTVSLEFSGRREEIALKPGEERRVELPLETTTGSVLVRIRSSAGFRPSEADPNSRDTRLLGVYCRVSY